MTEPSLTDLRAILPIVSTDDMLKELASRFTEFAAVGRLTGVGLGEDHAIVTRRTYGDPHTIVGLLWETQLLMLGRHLATSKKAPPEFASDGGDYPQTDTMTEEEANASSRTRHALFEVVTRDHDRIVATLELAEVDPRTCISADYDSYGCFFCGAEELYCADADSYSIPHASDCPWLRAQPKRGLPTDRPDGG